MSEGPTSEELMLEAGEAVKPLIRFLLKLDALTGAKHIARVDAGGLDITIDLSQPVKLPPTANE